MLRFAVGVFLGTATGAVLTHWLTAPSAALCGLAVAFVVWSWTALAAAVDALLDALT